MDYWKWFFINSEYKPGFRRLFNWWFLLHLTIGYIISWLTPLSLKECANAVLLPLAGIFVGLSFAWAGNAQALMESSEIEHLSRYHKGGFQEYVFTYQTAILAIMITLILWGFAGLDIFDKTWPTKNNSFFYKIVKGVLFSFASLTLRECWHVIMGTQWMLLVRRRIKNSTINESKE